MLKEDYVSFEVAKLLKDKGFDEYCFAAYSTEIGDFISVGPIKNSEIDANKDDKHICTAPTIQMVSEWLRQKYNIHITTEWYYKNTPEETNDMSVVYITYIDSPTNPNIDFETSAHTEPQDAICEAHRIALNEI